MSEQSRQSSELGDEPTSTRNADAAPTPQNPPGAAAVPPEKPKANPRRNMLLGALGVRDPGRPPFGSAFPGSRRPSTRFRRTMHTSTVT